MGTNSAIKKELIEAYCADFDPKMKGSMLRNRRKMLGLTQSQLGRLLGLTRVTISLYENDRTSIPRTVWLAVEMLLADAHRFSVSIPMEDDQVRFRISFDPPVAAEPVA